MLLDRVCLEVAKFASKDETRPSIQCIRVKPNHVEATDGHRLMRVSTPKKCDPVDFPDVKGCIVTCDVPEEGVLVPAHVALKVAKNIPKNGNLPIINYAGFDGTSLVTMGDDLSSHNVTNFREVEGMFPDVDKVFPTGKPTRRVSVNAKYLAEIAAFIQTNCKTSAADAHVFFDFYGGDDSGAAVRFSAVDSDGHTIEVEDVDGLLMPCRVND